MPELLGTGEKIVFYRTDGVPWPIPAFMIDPDGSHETALHDGGLLPGSWSPDGMRLAVPHLVTDQSPQPGAETEWIRPALVNADGSGFKVLDAYPDRDMHLNPVAWSRDGSRIFVFSGNDAVNPVDVGLYTMRSSDGGDLSSVMVSPPGDPDTVDLAPDGSKLLVNRHSKGLDGTLLVVNVDGTGQHQLNPAGTTPVDLEFWGSGDGHPRISEAWSPDGTMIAFTVGVKAVDSTALFVINPEGTSLHQIVPPTVGAVSAQWSPDGKLIAFTSRFLSQPQVWVVRSDGSGLTRLTDGADGSASVMPVWSPDGTKLLFQRKLAGQVTLWTMNADGTTQTQLSKAPLATGYTGTYEYVGGYAWWPDPES